MITLKTPQEIETMREGGTLLAQILEKLILRVKPGITTKDLDRAASVLILQSGAQLAFQGYLGFPGVLCASINEEIVHVIPGSRALQEGDILTLDIGLVFKGFYLDMARTVGVGNIDSEKKRIIQITKQALELGIKTAKAGIMIGDIGVVIQKFAERNGYNVVRELCGHGIGKKLHEDPQVLNYDPKHKTPVIKEGMVFCIEPMITKGHWKLKRAKDNYGFTTKDNSLSCHFEDTIAITSSGTEVLTK